MLQARQSSQEGGNLLLSLLACVLECIYSLIEYLTRFAIIMSAIIGTLRRMGWCRSLLGFWQSGSFGQATKLQDLVFLCKLHTPNILLLKLAQVSRCWSRGGG